jgi:hypothetical protein
MTIRRPCPYDEDIMVGNAVIPLYLLVLTGQVAHVFEETWGRSWLIGAVHGLRKERPAV